MPSGRRYGDEVGIAFHPVVEVEFLYRVRSHLHHAVFLVFCLLCGRGLLRRQLSIPLRGVLLGLERGPLRALIGRILEGYPRNVPCRVRDKANNVCAPVRWHNQVGIEARFNGLHD